MTPEYQSKADAMLRKSYQLAKRKWYIATHDKETREIKVLAEYSHRDMNPRSGAAAAEVHKFVKYHGEDIFILDEIKFRTNIQCEAEPE